MSGAPTMGTMLSDGFIFIHPLPLFKDTDVEYRCCHDLRPQRGQLGREGEVLSKD